MLGLIWKKPTKGKYNLKENILNQKTHQCFPLYLKKSKKSIRKIEKRDEPQLVKEYSAGILEYLKETENANTPKYEALLVLQSKSYEKRRAFTIERLASLPTADKWRLHQESFHLAINILDRYASLVKIQSKELDLIGLTSLFIACKLEDTYPPKINDFLIISGNKYTKSELFKTEYEILSALNFDILSITPVTFLNYYLTHCDKNIKIVSLSRYILDICSLEISFCMFSSSIKAACALYIARALNRETVVWDDELKFHSGLKKEDIRMCLREAIDFLDENKDKFKTSQIYAKYSTYLYRYSSMELNGVLKNK